jgi:hypothetical protein
MFKTKSSALWDNTVSLVPFTHANGRLVPEKQWPIRFSESNVTASTESRERLRKLLWDMPCTPASLLILIAVFDSFVSFKSLQLAPSQQKSLVIYIRRRFKYLTSCSCLGRVCLLGKRPSCGRSGLCSMQARVQSRRCARGW